MNFLKQDKKMLIVLLNLTFFICVNGGKLPLYQDDELQHDIVEKPPKVFKIIEKNDKILLQPYDKEEYDRETLIKFLKNNADLEYRVKNILNRGELTWKYNKGMKSRFVKRIVPHGQDTADLQYDKKKNMYFKPLIRFHKTKKLTNNPEETKDRKSIIPQTRIEKKTGKIIELDTIKDLLKQKLMDKLDGLTGNEKFKIGESVSSEMNKEDLLSPLELKEERNYEDDDQLKPTEAQHAIQHLYDINTLIDKIHSFKIRSESHKQLQDVISAIENLHKTLLLVTHKEKLRSGAPHIEDRDKDMTTEMVFKMTVAPNVNLTMDIVDGPEKISEKPCALYPNQPIWNYWTYKNLVHVDDCPDDLVKIDNVCARFPPHKK